MSKVVARLSRPVEYLYAVTVIEDYIPLNTDELIIYKNQILYVLQEQQERNHLLCFSPTTTETGKVYKMLVERLNPFTVYAAIVLIDHPSTFNEEVLSCFKGDKLLVVSQYDDDYVYCKKSSSKSVYGRVLIKNLFIEGEDLKALPTFEKYLERDFQTFSAQPSPTLKRLNEEPKEQRNKLSNSLASLNKISKSGKS
eukprot:NODE_398_length_8105_cov_1.375094.p7 type:complete len:197 gc:universal NODE_398_length_8105_cov_1.375094:6084-5494(-)